MEQPQQQHQQHQQHQQQNPRDQKHRHKMDKLRDTILTQLATLNPSKPITHDVVSLIEQRLHDTFPTLHTPTHHPYASMIRRAIMELNEEGGSSEEAISGFIKREYDGLPWAHASLLSHHLSRLCGNGEIVVTGNRGYMILVEDEEEMWRRNEDKVESMREQEEKIKEESQFIEEIEEHSEGYVDIYNGVKGEKIEVFEEQCEEEESKAEVFGQKIEAFETQGQPKQRPLRLRIRGPSKPESATGTTIEGRQTPPKIQTDVNTNIEVLMPSNPQNHHEQQAPKRRGRGRLAKAKPDAKPVVGVLMPLDYEHHNVQQQQPQGQGRRKSSRLKSDVDTTMGVSDHQHPNELQQQQPQGQGRRKSSRLKSDVDTTMGVSDHQHPNELQQQQPQGRGRGRRPKAKGSTAITLEALLPSQHQGQQQKPQSRGRGKHPKQKSDEVIVNADLLTSRDKSSSRNQLQPKRRGQRRNPK